MTATGTVSYPSLAAFYQADSRRDRSPEADYGVWWRHGRYPYWRVSYIRDTGEIYAVGMGGRGQDRVMILGTVPASDPWADPAAASVRTARWYWELDGILDGWADQDRLELMWVWHQLRAAGHAAWPPPPLPLVGKTTFGITVWPVPLSGNRSLAWNGPGAKVWLHRIIGDSLGRAMTPVSQPCQDAAAAQAAANAWYRDHYLGGPPAA